MNCNCRGGDTCCMFQRRLLGINFVNEQSKPVIKFPDGVPEGWHVTVDEDGVPEIRRG